MIELLDYINEDNIIDLEETEQRDYTRKLVSFCLQEFSEKDIQAAVSRVAASCKSTGLNLSKGFSLIHLRMDTVDNIRLAVGIPRTPVKYGKNELLKAIFCIIIPDTKCRIYLSLMAHLTRLLSQPDAKDVFEPGNKTGIIEFIRCFEES